MQNLFVVQQWQYTTYYKIQRVSSKIVSNNLEWDAFTDSCIPHVKSIGCIQLALFIRSIIIRQHLQGRTTTFDSGLTRIGDGT